MMYELIKTDRWEFLALSFLTAFEILMAYLFLMLKTEKSEIACAVLILFAAIQIFVALRMTTRRRYEENKKLAVNQ